MPAITRAPAPQAVASDPAADPRAAARAPKLSSQVPDSTSYGGMCLTELRFPAQWFIPVDRPEILQDADLTLQNVSDAMFAGFNDRRFFPLARPTVAASMTLQYFGDTGPWVVTHPFQPITPRLYGLTPQQVYDALRQSPRLYVNVFLTSAGELDCNFLPLAEDRPEPRLLLLEDYRLSSFLGAYGAGRTLKTFSLLPGETTKLTMKTYSRQEQDSKNATSILDSLTDDSSRDFERSVQREQSDKRAASRNQSYYAEVDASANIGVYSASLSAGVKGGTAASRDEFAKTISHATEKHAAKASAKRDIQINTTAETKVEAGEETAIERQVRNINLSRTLNFVFRQMNQEYITLLHLVDARVAYFDGHPDTKREVPMHELDSLIEQFIQPDDQVPGARAQVRQAILGELQYVFDHEGRPQALVEERVLLRDPAAPPDGANLLGSYPRVRKDLASTYDDGVNRLTVAGIILAADRHVLRTDGVIVDCLLGEGDGLDPYSHGLQDETVRGQVLANQRAERLAKREELGQRVVSRRLSDAAKVFGEVFAAPPADAGNGGPHP